MDDQIKHLNSTSETKGAELIIISVLLLSQTDHLTGWPDLKSRLRSTRCPQKKCELVL